MDVAKLRASTWRQNEYAPWTASPNMGRRTQCHGIGAPIVELQGRPQLCGALVTAAEVGEVDAEHRERAELGRGCADRTGERESLQADPTRSSWRQASINPRPSAASACARSGEGVQIAGAGRWRGHAGTAARLPR
jgi:hypothetical protein